MKVALYNLEPWIVNSAMMQVSEWHRERCGDKVELYHPERHKMYDKTYAFSIFTYTPKDKVTPDMICGGSGFWPDNVQLTPEMEDCDYDWSLYSDCDHSLIWFSKGCINKCPFCIVREKEGFIRPVKPKNPNPNGQYIKVMDNNNNFFANPKWREAIAQLKEWEQPCDFQGVDARIMTEEMCRALLTLKFKRRIHIAWDNPKEDLIPKFKEIIKIIKPYRLMCYVLIGYWSTPEEDLYRTEELRKLGIDPFVMPYNKEDRYQKDFTRYVNCKQIWRNNKFEDYERGKKNEAKKINTEGLPDTAQ